MSITRVTQGIEYRQTLGTLQKNYGNLYRLQQELATNKRIQTPSDDPLGTARLLGYRRYADQLQQYQAGGAQAQSSLDTTSGELSSLNDAYQDAREKITAGLNGTLDAGGREIIANQIDSALTQMLNAANAKLEDRQLFAGSKTGTVPFVRQIGPDGIERVVYQGDEQASPVSVGPGIQIDANLPGSRLIATGVRGATVFRGTTGARPGAGTDSGKGHANLVLAHTQTSFVVAGNPVPTDPASGLRLGSSSAAQDTILGAGHSVAIANGPSGTRTIALDGGTAVPFTASDTNLAVSGPNGELVHLDLSAVNGGFQGTVLLRGDGTVSTDGGRTADPISFTATGQQVINSADGSVTHLDATQVRQAGTTDVSYPGTSDIFNSLLRIRDLLRTRGTDAQVRAALDQARGQLGELDRSADTIAQLSAEVGGSAAHLATLADHISGLQLDNTQRQSDVEDADIAEVTVHLKEQEAAYQAALVVTSQLGQLSLLGFIR